MLFQSNLTEITNWVPSLFQYLSWPLYHHSSTITMLAWIAHAMWCNSLVVAVRRSTTWRCQTRRCRRILTTPQDEAQTRSSLSSNNASVAGLSVKINSSIFSVLLYWRYRQLYYLYVRLKGYFNLRKESMLLQLASLSDKKIFSSTCIAPETGRTDFV